MPGVYISYPFCSQKCSYCNFASGVFSRDLEARYLASLRTEIAGREWDRTPETVYLGGGTPSRLSAEELAGILECVPGRPWLEATIEAAPGAIDEAAARAWGDCGVDRVSLGVQSFETRELARTGRKHTAEIVEREVATLRAAGLGNINIDLIAGLPGQTCESWRRSIEWIKRLDPPHVSVYMLEVDEDSRLGNEVLLNGKRYGAPDIPPDDGIAEFYETAVEELRRMGIERYEISNFARPGFESLHNGKYWRLEPYVGFGADAHSFDGAMRFQNVESPAEYADRIEGGQSPRAAEIAADSVEERFFVGLRLSEGIHPEAEEWRRFQAPIARFIEEGLLEAEGGTLRLTNRGVLLSNEVFAEFINA
jgi:oxygen-independent coproporphyrinogen-3 oxidase